PAILVSSGAMTGIVNAVYVPSRYCKVPAMDAGGCTSLGEQNGDVAVLKVQALAGKFLSVMPTMRLAPGNLAMRSMNYLMALGYGANTSAAPDSSALYYIDYRYYANNSYRNVAGESIILNGWQTGGGAYASIVCQGDSGGGDFYWDGTYWDLVGAHSYGPTPCGVRNVSYTKAYDASADVRPFSAWIQDILRKDVTATGCAALGAAYVCKSRT
ncbi:MAG: trypsin-like serine protease, partial [Candidatus Eremiobacteraeota bacterium]|nr:trypsin-like serine protease [Candidatus Eremiobacteraeota bacterium]